MTPSKSSQDWQFFPLMIYSSLDAKMKGLDSSTGSSELRLVFVVEILLHPPTEYNCFIVLNGKDTVTNERVEVFENTCTNLTFFVTCSEDLVYMHILKKTTNPKLF